MRIKHVFLFTVCLTLLLTAMPLVPDLEAGGPEPGDTATVTGPELWGVVIFYCDTGNEWSIARVKRVVGCNVETETLYIPGAPYGCPAAPADLEGKSLEPGQTFFGLTGTAFINKVKNFKVEGDVVSCDAQFKFWQ